MKRDKLVERVGGWVALGLMMFLLGYSFTQRAPQNNFDPEYSGVSHVGRG